jgi:hypothetical protein
MCRPKAGYRCRDNGYHFHPRPYRGLYDWGYRLAFMGFCPLIRQHGQAGHPEHTENQQDQETEDDSHANQHEIDTT